MKIAIGSDHAGYELKEKIIKLFQAELQEHHLKDFGCSGAEQSVDYPNIANEVCTAILRSEFERGILICGSGIGISIAANRHRGIRAALCADVIAARLCRQHNNANILCLGDWFVTGKMAAEITKVWLTTEFEGGRHQRRVDLLD